MEEEKLQLDITPKLQSDLISGHERRSLLFDVSTSLQLYDKISIIFLLCDTAQSGLEAIDSILSSNTTTQSSLFYKWLTRSLNENWKAILAEALVIIQNFRLSKILGYQKEDSIKQFEPKNNLKAYNIPLVRKLLYNVCEDLTKADCDKLVATVEGCESTQIKYLERKLLNWNVRGTISFDNDRSINLQPLYYLETLGYKSIFSDMLIVIEKTNCDLVRRKYYKSNLGDYYDVIDENNLGWCVIINEKNFLGGLFPKRWGSDKDAERLTEVFTAFGFDVKLHIDVTYSELIGVLKLYAQTIPKSSSLFVLVILSHGSENVIYTSDSKAVDMNTIEMLFQAEVCPNLIGKPKIFIIQSCQGQKWQKVVQNSEPDVETDNIESTVAVPSVLVGPQKGDSMIAWSTVQGFASFRDKYNGSWYIQELCNELWKFGGALDLVEILTRVNNNLRSKVYGGQYMVPSLLLSLRAKIKFPVLKEKYKTGRTLMLKRLLFEKCFRDFLSGCEVIQKKMIRNL